MGIDTTNNQTVAIKILNDSISKDQKIMLTNEINTMAQIDHPNVVKCIDHGEDYYIKPRTN